MKRFISLSLFIVTSLSNVQSQTVITNDYSTPVEPVNNTSQRSQENEELQSRQSGTGVDYNAIKKGWGLGYSYVLKNFVFGFSDDIGETNSIVTRNSAITFYCGYNRRYYFNNIIWIEGRAMIGGYYESISYKIPSLKSYLYTIESENNFYGFIGISPRIGVNVCELWGGQLALTAGYRWDFVDFKFDTDWTRDYLTLGFSWIF